MMFALLLLVQPAELPDCDQEAADRGVQQEMNICAHRDFLIADAKLNAQWKKTRAKMKALDADFAEYQPDGDGRPGWFQSLLAAQRAWLTYRDAHCRVDGYTARGGSLEPLLVSTCKTALTNARTAELESLANSPE